MFRRDVHYASLCLAIVDASFCDRMWVYDERSSCQTGDSISGGRTRLDSIHLCQVEISMAITSSVVESMLHIPLTL